MDLLDLLVHTIKLISEPLVGQNPLVSNGHVSVTRFGELKEPQGSLWLIGNKSSVRERIPQVNYFLVDCERWIDTLDGLVVVGDDPTERVVVGHAVLHNAVTFGQVEQGGLNGFGRTSLLAIQKDPKGHLKCLQISYYLPHLQRVRIIPWFLGHVAPL